MKLQVHKHIIEPTAQQACIKEVTLMLLSKEKQLSAQLNTNKSFEFSLYLQLEELSAQTQNGTAHVRKDKKNQINKL